MKGGVIGFTETITDLLKIPDRLSTLERRLHRMEARMGKMEDAVQQLNEATDEIAADLERLRGDVANGDTSAAEKLTPLIERLRSLGQDPTNPVPEPPPSL